MSAECGTSGAVNSYANRSYDDLRQELRAWEEGTCAMSETLNEAMAREGVDEWEYLSGEWSDAIHDFFEGLERINDLRAALRNRQARAEG